jgi:uncharacterized protein (DUF1684 family)
MRKYTIPSIITFLFLTILTSTKAQTNFDVAELKKWDAERIAALKQPDGWLNLEGLFWLKKGVNSFGSSKENELVYDNAAFPKHLGDFIYEDGKVYWKDAATEKITIKDNAGLVVANAETLNLLTATEGNYISQWKDFLWVVIKREERNQFGSRRKGWDGEYGERF